MSIDSGQPYLSPPPPSAGPGYPIGQPVPAPRRRRTGVVAAVAGVVGVGVLAGGGYLAYGVLGGAGDRADVALPGTAVAAVTLDLDPSVSQKLGAIQFARKFPESRNLDWDSADRDPRKWIYERLTEDAEQAPAWSEVQAWLGKRAGLAVLPDAAGDAKEGPAVVIALQVSDSGKARTSLAKLSEGGKPAGIAGEGEWVVVAETQAEADAAWSAAKASPLSDSATYRSDVDALGGEGLANIWVDATRLAAIDAALPMGGVLGGATTQAGGHGAMTVRFDGPTLELAGAFRDVKPTAAALAGSVSADTALPATSIGVLSVGGLGDQIAAAWPELERQLADLGGTGSTAELEQQSGLKLPGDLKALLGSQLALVVEGNAQNPVVGLRVRSDDPELPGALDRLSAFAERDLGQSLAPQQTDGGYLLGLGGDVPAGLADGGTLGSTGAFTKAVPDADGAAMIGYLDIAKAVEAFSSGLSAKDREQVAPLQSVGFSARKDGDSGSRFTFRLTTKD